MPMTPASSKSVWFCSNVGGGGVHGGGHVDSWRALGLDARLHHLVDLADYWKAKSGAWSALQLRWAMYVSYPLMLRRAVRAAGGGGIFVAVTNPFFLPALAARAARRGSAKIINLVYDLYPDALVFGGGLKESHPGARFAAATTKAAIRNCAATVYLGERLRQYAEQRYGVARRTAVIPVGTDATVFRGCEPAPRSHPGLQLLYSGHMGRLHDWQTPGDALREGVPDLLRVEIASDGPGAARLKEQLKSVAGAEGGPLVFAGTRGRQEWKKAMLRADVALVTMRPGAEKVVMPSKTYSAMAAGQAILAVCPKESDLADLVARHDCGWIVEPGDAAGLRALLKSLPQTQRAGELQQKRRNAYAAAHAHYSMEATAPQWAGLFMAVSNGD